MNLRDYILTKTYPSSATLLASWESAAATGKRVGYGLGTGCLRKVLALDIKFRFLFFFTSSKFRVIWIQRFGLATPRLYI